MTLILDKDNPLRTKVQTTNGQPATLLSVAVRSLWPIAALVRFESDCGPGECVKQFNLEGVSDHALPWIGDLINAPEEVELTIWHRSLLKSGIAAVDYCVSDPGDNFGVDWRPFARIKVRKGEGL